jgi:hypothetical protein
VEVTAWPPYCFKEVLGELCEIYRRDDGGGGEGEGTVGKEGVVVVRTDGQCLCGNETGGKKGSSHLSAGIKTEVKSLKGYKKASKKRSKMKRVAAAEKAKMTSGKKKQYHIVPNTTSHLQGQRAVSKKKNSIARRTSSNKPQNRS